MGASAKTMARNIMNGAKHGAVVIMHFHRPEWGEAAALKAVVPALRSRGYTFDKLKNFPLKPVSGTERPGAGPQENFRKLRIKGAL